MNFIQIVNINCVIFFQDPSLTPCVNKHFISWCQFITEQVNYLKELEFEPTYKGKMLAIVRGSDVSIISF